MNEKLELNTSPKLKAARWIVFLVFLFIIVCAVEALRGDWVGEKETDGSQSYSQQQCVEGELWL
jgi:hypothetical protein